MADACVPLPRLLALVGALYRWLPMFRGKYSLAQRYLAPRMRRRGYRTVVRLHGPGGARLICHLDDWIPWTVFVFGRYISEAQYEEYLLSRVRPGPSVFLDIGANIGYYTVQMARLAGPEARIHAFEPMSIQGAVLEENLRLNHLTNVVVNASVVSDTVGVQRIYFSSPENTGQSSVARPSGYHEDRSATTVDAYCQTQGIEAVELVKIDVEGHELHVLRGMERMLREGRVARVATELDEELLAANGASADLLLSLMRSHGYEPHRVRSGRLVPFTASGDEQVVVFERVESRQSTIAPPG